MSCAFVGGKCKVNVCWTRESAASKISTCKVSKAGTLPKCMAFQISRAFICLGIFVLTVATSIILVSFCMFSRTLAAVGGFASFLAGLLLMTSFALFYSEEFARVKMGRVASVGYSFILLAFAWVGALMAGLLSCFAASMGLRSKELSEYSRSGF